MALVDWIRVHYDLSRIEPIDFNIDLMRSWRIDKTPRFFLFALQSVSTQDRSQ